MHFPYICVTLTNTEVIPEMFLHFWWNILLRRLISIDMIMDGGHRRMPLTQFHLFHEGCKPFLSFLASHQLRRLVKEQPQRGTLEAEATDSSIKVLNWNGTEDQEKYKNICWELSLGEGEGDEQRQIWWCPWTGSEQHRTSARQNLFQSLGNNNNKKNKIIKIFSILCACCFWWSTDMIKLMVFAIAIVDFLDWIFSSFVQSESRHLQSECRSAVVCIHIVIVPFLSSRAQLMGIRDQITGVGAGAEMKRFMMVNMMV